MNLRQSNKDAHPGRPDMASSQHRSSQQVADERMAKEQAKMKLEGKKSKSCQAVVNFEEALTSKGITNSEPMIVEKLPQPQRVAPKVLDEESRKPTLFECWAYYY